MAEAVEVWEKGKAFKTRYGKDVDPKYGNYWEGGVEYVDDGTGTASYMPKGGWGAATAAQIEEDARVKGLAKDQFGVSPFERVERADGSFAPGVYGANDEYYGGAQVKPVGGTDTQGRPEYIPGELDKANNPTWVINPDYGKAKGVNTVNPNANPYASNSDLSGTSAKTILSKLIRDMFGNSPKYSSEIAGVTTQLQALMVDGASELEVTQTIRESDFYKKRFPGMEARAMAGMSAISEADYIGLEDSYRNAMRISGLSEEFADNDALYGDLIAGDVSAAELQTRVALAETAANGSDPAILAQIEEFYPEMLEGNRLVEYYLDPEGAVNLYEEQRRQRAAGLSVSTLRAVGQGLNLGMAEALERENIQSREIQSRLGQRKGLTDRLLGEEAALTASEIASGEFGLEAEQATKLRRRREERVAGFSGQAGVLTTNAGIKGLGTATQWNCGTYTVYFQDC